MVMKWIRKDTGDGSEESKTAITLDMFKQILRLLNPEIEFDCVIMLAFLFAEFGLLRGSEFCYKKEYPERALRLNNIEFIPIW